MSMCPRRHFASLALHVVGGLGSTCHRVAAEPPSDPPRHPRLTLLAETALGPSNVRRGEGNNGQNYPHTGTKRFVPKLSTMGYWYKTHSGHRGHVVFFDWRVL
eukprot:1362055-Prymnesium_polylepis.1